MTELNIYQQYNDIKDEIAKLELQVKGFKSQKDNLEQAIIEDMQNRGETFVKRDGHAYLIKVAKHWPKIVDQMKMVNWFWNNDIKERLTVNSQTLGSFIKETETIPEGVETSEKVSLQCKKA